MKAETQMEYFHQDRMNTTIRMLDDLGSALDHMTHAHLFGDEVDAPEGVIGLASGRILRVVSIDQVPGMNSRKLDDDVLVVHLLEDGAIAERICISSIETVQTALPLKRGDEPLVAPDKAKALAMETIKARGVIPDNDVHLEYGMYADQHRTPFMHEIVMQLEKRGPDDAFRRKLWSLIPGSLVADDQVHDAAAHGLSDEEAGILRQAVARDRIYGEMIRSYRPYISRDRWLTAYRHA
jgi:hypothetical protein